MGFSVRVPALLATLCAFVALLVVATLGPMICKEITDAWQEFDNDMEQFKVISNDLWYEMMEMGKTQGMDRNKRFTTQRLRVRPTRPQRFSDSLLARPPARSPFERRPVIAESRDNEFTLINSKKHGIVPPLPIGLQDPPLPNRNRDNRRGSWESKSPGRRPHDWDEHRDREGRAPGRRPNDWERERPFERAMNNIGYGLYSVEEEELPIPSRPPPPATRRPQYPNEQLRNGEFPGFASPQLLNAERSDFGRSSDRWTSPSTRPDDYFDGPEIRPGFENVFLSQRPSESPNFGVNPTCSRFCLATKCPAGLPGVQGAPGELGDRGIPGPHGFTGKDAYDVQMQIQNSDECHLCPAGSPGPPGESGVVGPLGPSGGSGTPGRNGQHGLPGRHGGKGNEGTGGPMGSAGRQGERGECAVKGTTGPRGNKGITGIEGLGGAPGRLGLNGPDGNTGDQGPAGTVGSSGAGGPGGSGVMGEQGRPGNDGVYCSCPKREFYNPGDDFAKETRHDAPLIPNWHENNL